jgi:ACS family tartrate transporter-like MFS transporter
MSVSKNTAKSASGVGTSDLSPETIRRVSWRVLPIVLLGFFLAYLDRTNVSMAALTMSADLGFTAKMFGMGSSIFFIGYVIFEVPSNMALQKFGSRIWFARIMFTWGLFAVGMAFVWNDYSFYIGRFLLGVAEAGFYPGLIFYFTYWFPAEYRTRMIGILLVGNPLSAMIGAPLGGLLLELNGVWGLAGWQWLFIVEGVPTLILSAVILFFLPDRPANASWLNAQERNSLERVLEQERTSTASIRTDSLRSVLLSGRVWLLGICYLGIIIGLYGLGFFLPQIIKAFGGISNTTVGYLAAIPSLCAVVATIYWPRHSDMTGERVWHIAIASMVGFIGLAVAAYSGSPTVSLIALSAASAGIMAALATFWSLPTTLLSGSAAAAGIAFINSIAAAGGFFGPNMMGWLKDTTGDYRTGLLVLASSLVVTAIIALSFKQAISRARHG